MPYFEVSPLEAPPFPSLRISLCPVANCRGIMTSEQELKLLHGTGLERLCCPVCDHNGFRAVEGIRKLFGGQHEHVCSYGPSLLTLTVLFSGAALALFRDRGFNPTEAALYSAHWALLSGQVAGTVNLLSDTSTRVRCLEYLTRQMNVSVESISRVAPVGLNFQKA